VDQVGKQTCKLLSGILLQISGNELEQMFPILTMMVNIRAKEFGKFIRKKAIEISDLGRERHRR
jgi:hypothetical protein